MGDEILCRCGAVMHRTIEGRYVCVACNAETEPAAVPVEPKAVQS